VRQQNHLNQQLESTNTAQLQQQQQQQQQQPSNSSTLPQSSIASSTTMVNIKQEPQIPMSNVQMRSNPQNLPIQQQQIK
ncbi:unnamed protein product, partial [Rotaria sp. Silwood1]